MASLNTVDPKTGDYILEGGSPQETNSLAIPAYVRWKVKRNTWMYAPNDQYGSDFHTLNKLKRSSDATLFENVGARALAPIVEDGRADNIDVELRQRSSTGICLNAKITKADGRIDNLEIEPLGV